MNPALARLHAYPFERLHALLAGARPPPDLAPIMLSIGEPKHEPPGFVLEALAANLRHPGSYPATRGLPAASTAGHPRAGTMRSLRERSTGART